MIGYIKAGLKRFNMSALALVKESLFYREINTLMREQFPLIKETIGTRFEQIL